MHKRFSLLEVLNGAPLLNVRFEYKVKYLEHIKMSYCDVQEVRLCVEAEICKLWSN